MFFFYSCPDGEGVAAGGRGMEVSVADILYAFRNGHGEYQNEKKNKYIKTS